MKVDLPAPFGPRSPVMPGGTDTDTSFRPITWPYHFDTCSAATIAGGRDATGAATAAGAAVSLTGTGDVEAGNVTSPPRLIIQPGGFAPPVPPTRSLAGTPECPAPFAWLARSRSLGQRHVTTSTPRTRRSRMEIETTTS